MSEEKTAAARPEPKVAKDVAEAEFVRFMDAMDLDSAPVHRDEEDNKGFEDAKFEFVNAIMDGRIEIDSNGELDFRPQTWRMTDPIHFPEPTWEHIQAMDRIKQGHDIGKGLALIAKWTNRHETELKAMKSRDARVATAILSLFLASRSKPR